MRDRVRASQVQEATGMAPSKATETSTVTRPQQTTVTSQQTTVTPQQTGTVTGERGAGGNGTGMVQQVQGPVRLGRAAERLADLSSNAVGTAEACFCLYDRTRGCLLWRLECSLEKPLAVLTGKWRAWQVQQGAQRAYEQVTSAAPLQRVVEYGQAAAAKASEQANAAYQCAPHRARALGLTLVGARQRCGAAVCAQCWRFSPVKLL